MTCPVGHYNTESVCILPQQQQQGSDPATSTTMLPCSPCPACPSGKYLAKACSGVSMGKPDHICQPCASCPMDTYIAACRNVGGNSTSQTSAEWLPPPPDAGKCTPCQTCAAGSYISQRCDGSKFTDDRQCSPCEAICAQGTYMHAKCSGNTFNASSNDCRQVSPT